MIDVRSLLVSLALLLLPATAGASVRIVDVRPSGPVLEGTTVDLVIETNVPVDAVRLTFPDLQGSFGATLCALRGSGSTRTVLPYRPLWAGLHSIQVSVTAGACGVRPQTSWRIVELDAAPARRPAAAPAATCPQANRPAIPRTMRAARKAVVCLLNAARAAGGAGPLATDERLRRVASRSARRAPRRPRRGEQRTVTPGDASVRAVVDAWLTNDAHRRDLLDPRVRRVGVAVVPRFPEPLRRPETTYVVELG